MPRSLRSLRWLAVFGVAALVQPAAARPSAPVLHEVVPPDPAEDIAMNVALDGDLPGALQTSSGIVAAPDPRRLPLPTDSAYGARADLDVFVPDRETRRPDVSGYDEPFTPSTAPFKRLEAFDGVRSDYRLYVHDQHLVAVSTGASLGPNDEAFYADLVVDIEGDRSVRIPSVGPGARIAHARLGFGPDEMPMRVMRDGADNWFLQVYGAKRALRARLVMEVVIAREAFGGQLGDPDWRDLPFVAPLPESVAREAAAVRAALAVNRRMRPREAIAKLVEYFRGFTDSDDSPRGRGSIYLDLALSKKGVCRHRSFAFLVTALSLGIPTRLVANEAHAWVEVHDGALWRRIDLGGAGHMAAGATDAIADRPAYEPPPDAFTWPQNAERGGDMLAEARAGEASGPQETRAPPTGPTSTGDSASGAAPPWDHQRSVGNSPTSRSPPTASTSGMASPVSVADDRPPSSVSIAAAGSGAHRGQPLQLSGSVRADGELCPHLAVELWLRAVETNKSFLLGTLATGDKGTFAGGIVVPADSPLGDYDVIARTQGDQRCGPGSSE